ncbi:hypothetical protein [Paraburkholderia madseniana]|uniref:hypothetical protein n=1 Tax=Paraburkholderia madseniana TaxID=2599607 RepID=UPI001411E5CE|nr:hypothetical protein [Paraburkholderia madseniana]
MRELRDLEHKQGEEETAAAKAAYAASRTWLLTFSALALQVSLASALFITRGLVSQLDSESTDAAGRIAAGDLTLHSSR